MNDEPLAYFLTWTTYGTWLPGDARGWVSAKSGGMRRGDLSLELRSRQLMAEPPLVLTVAMRDAVTEQLSETATARGWSLHATNVRSNHVHVVVSASNVKPARVMQDFKAWATRRLKRDHSDRTRFWTKGGSTRFLNDEESLEAAVVYVRDYQ